MSGEPRCRNPLLLFGFVGDGTGAACWAEEGYEDGGEVPFMRRAVADSRFDRP